MLVRFHILSCHTMLLQAYIISSIFAIVLAGIVPQDGHEDGPLNLTPFLNNGEIEKAKALSEVDPSLFAGVKSHAAYFTVNETGKWNTFFWYFPVDGAPVESTPLVIWLQGGPGSSSLFGLFTEIGPIRLNNQSGVERMPITWGSDYSLLFIDNPVGTGFSYAEDGNYATDEIMVGSCLLSFLDQFLKVFTDLTKVPLFITGESYAGKYIPALGHFIHKHNAESDSFPINLKGLAIGDGWTDPPTLMHYSELGLQLGLIDHEQAAVIHEQEEAARKYWKEGNYIAYVEAANHTMDLIIQYGSVADVYNFLNDNEYTHPQNFFDFLNRYDVQRALHVKKMKYQLSNKRVYAMMMNDFFHTVKPWLEELLEHYGVICYNGQLDVIVAYALSVNTYRSLQWSGAEKYRKAERIPLFDEDTKIVHGYLKASGNFMDVMIRGAGHMVPTDKPRAAKLMIDMFINKFK